MRVVEVRVHSKLMVNNTSYQWWHDVRNGGGFLQNFGVHFIDVISYVTGKRASKVHSSVLTTLKKQTDKVNGFREITSDDFCAFQMQIGDIVCDVTFNNNFPG